MLISQFARSCALAAAIALPAAATALAQDDVVVRVGDATITNADVSRATDMLGPRLTQVPEEQRREVVIQALIDLQVMANAARAAGIDESADFKAELSFLESQALRDIYFEQEIEGSVGEDEVRARYEEEIAKLDPQEEIQARHILVETAEEADELIDELDNGADFAELAQQHSTGPSGPKGGDLGYFSKGQMVPEFEAAAFALEPGAYTEEPVKTQFGFHIIKVEDKREQQPPAFADVEEQLREAMVRELLTQRLAELKDATTVERLDAPADAAPESDAATTSGGNQ
ncbi:peptidylprolyl isomerase [Amorphus coralli]|uniref:peptidylprolyl isomerase n=1 Tax=Amorphus coralli TaxID=340680 RepID=UPI00036B6707|nr:peptidylprolyl isomerase [Amorphus coralli]